MRQFAVRIKTLSLGSLLLVGAVCSASAAEGTPSTSAAATTATTATATLADLQHAPLAVYQQKCMLCHGPNAKFHRERVSQLDDALLKRRVGEMLRDNARLKTTPAEQAAMVAFHRAIQQQPPADAAPLFIAVTNASTFSSTATTQTAAGAARELRGEATAGAQLVLRTAGKEQPIALEGTAWKLTDAPAPPFVIEGQLGTQRATLDFPAQQWTHAAPPATK